MRNHLYVMYLVMHDLRDYAIENFEIAKDVCKKKCNDEHENCIDRTSSYYNVNISLKIMKRMGFKCKGPGKGEWELRNLIETIVRPKYENLGYDIGSGKMNKGSKESIESIKIVQCSHCNKKGHTKDRCLDLISCSICGLRNHFIIHVGIESTIRNLSQVV